MKHNNIFVSTTFAPSESGVLAVVEDLLRQNITNIELGSTHRYEPDIFDQLSTLPCRFLVHNYFPIPENHFIVNIASRDNVIRNRSVQHVITAIDFCADIGAELYTFHPGFLTDPLGASTSHTDFDFQFSDKWLKNANYQKAYNLMLKGIDVIAVHAAQRKVRIAIETEGSVQKSGHLLMQTPQEFLLLFKHFSPQEIGVSLNIGHLNLAANVFDFRVKDFVDTVAPALVSIEMSHNYGRNDDHLPLQEGAWYWPLILDKRFSSAPKILEVRETSLTDLVENIRLCKRVIDGGSECKLESSRINK